MTYARQLERTWWLAALPALLLLALLAWPLSTAVLTSLGLTGQGHAASASAWLAVWGEPLFRRALLLNIWVPLASLTVEAVLGVVMALWFYHLRRAVAFWRTLALIPFALPEIVYLLTMKMLLRQHGYLNSGLAGFGVTGPDWLAPGSWLLPLSVILVDAWRVTPMVFLIVLAALEQVPQSTIEAARIDGASGWQTSRHILLPMIVPAMLVALGLRAIDAFRIFATPMVLAGIEPFPVISSVAYHYQMNQHDPVRANVAALSLTALLVLLMALLLGWAERRGHRNAAGGAS